MQHPKLRAENILSVDFATVECAVCGDRHTRDPERKEHGAADQGHWIRKHYKCIPVEERADRQPGYAPRFLT